MHQHGEKLLSMLDFACLADALIRVFFLIVDSQFLEAVRQHARA